MELQSATEASEPLTKDQAAEVALPQPAQLELGAGEASASEARADGASTSDPDAGTEPDDASATPVDRKRIAEQLEALKRKEAELRRALAISDHPELADAIRALEGRAYAVARAEAKMAQGLSKSEERRRDTLEKKLASLREKRAELDAHIGELEAELSSLTEERVRAFEGERRDAMERLLAALGTHEAALRAAGLEASSLVPEIAGFMPEIRALAEALVAKSPRHAS